MIDPLAEARLAVRLCAHDPALGGLVLRGGGDVRDALLAEIRAELPPGAPFCRVPAHIDDERLLGGIDLAATLARGAPVMSAGLLAQARGGIVVLPMAERMPDALAGKLAAAMDQQAGFVTVALEDGAGSDECPPPALAERLAFWLDLSEVVVDPRAALAMEPAPGPAPPPPRRDPPGDPLAPDQVHEALVAAATALGIDSARAPLFALRAARAAAALDARASIARGDCELAARLVLAPRATRLPAPPDPSQSDPPPPPEGEGEGEHEQSGELADVVLAAAAAALPSDVLARIANGPVRRNAGGAEGAGERRRSPLRGRPRAARAGMPGGGRRLALIDTLRAAAPWQRLRGRADAGGRADRIAIRRDDLRIRRFESRAEMLTIFAVDASGSSALARLAEAKGAVELLLASAYVKRAHVALVAFRGTGAELLLPPTRALARARRALAALPGGGGTPLAAGLDAARALAEAAQARGRTPFLVVLTDGRANIAADGRAVREAAEADALAAARAIAGAGIAGAFVDIAPRPRPEGARLAAAMRARYLPLPRADAATLHAAIRQAQA